MFTENQKVTLITQSRDTVDPRCTAVSYYEFPAGLSCEGWEEVILTKEEAETLNAGNYFVRIYQVE